MSWQVWEELTDEGRGAFAEWIASHPAAVVKVNSDGSISFRKAVGRETIATVDDAENTRYALEGLRVAAQCEPGRRDRWHGVGTDESMTGKDALCLQS